MFKKYNRKDFYLEEDNRINDKTKYLIFIFFGLITLIFGLFRDSYLEIIRGIYQIIIQPDQLISDYIGVGGIGAAFVNSGLLILLVIIILLLYKVSLNGLALVSIWMVGGFAFLGENIFNIWLIVGGVFAYAKYQQDNFSDYIFIALLGSGLAPLASYVIFQLNLIGIIRLFLGILIGFIIGFIISPLAAFLLRVHQGYNLYNIGFTAGIIGTIFISILRLYDLEIRERFIWSTGNNMILASYLVFIFSLLIFIGFLLNQRSFKGVKEIFSYPGRLVSDFTILVGFAPTLINMGINGLVTTLIIILIKGDLNGAVIAGIYTVVGFGAFGKHIKNIFPIMLGVYLSGLTVYGKLNEPVITLTALFATTLAPITGEFGWKIGIIAGFLHSSLVQHITCLHGGFNLFNNGFAGGIVAAVLIPVLESLRRE